MRSRQPKTKFTRPALLDYIMSTGRSDDEKLRRHERRALSSRDRTGARLNPLRSGACVAGETRSRFSPLLAAPELTLLDALRYWTERQPRSSRWRTGMAKRLRNVGLTATWNDGPRTVAARLQEIGVRGERGLVALSPGARLRRRLVRLLLCRPRSRCPPILRDATATWSESRRSRTIARRKWR
jgi:hypothetical protein